MENHQTPPAPTTRDRLLRQFDSVFEDIDAFLAERDEGRREEMREQLEPLAFMRRTEHTIQIAWGGPEYGFKLYHDPEAGEWVGGVFYFADWFTYEESPLSQGELERVLDAYSMDCMPG